MQLWNKATDLTVTRFLRRPKRKIVVPALNAKVGATSGWVITAGTNISHATLPASQTGSTLVVPISGLMVGDKVTDVAAVGQVESGGNNATCTMSVRKLSASAAAALTDAEIGSDTMGTIAADALLTDANGTLKVSGLAEELAENEQLYCLFTATTAAATDIDLSHLVITLDRNK